MKFEFLLLFSILHLNGFGGFGGFIFRFRGFGFEFGFGGFIFGFGGFGFEFGGVIHQFQIFEQWNLVLDFDNSISTFWNFFSVIGSAGRSVRIMLFFQQNNWISDLNWNWIGVIIDQLSTNIFKLLIIIEWIEYYCSKGSKTWVLWDFNVFD